MVFRFTDTNVRLTNKALKRHEEGLTRVLNDTMPGLAPGSSGDTIHSASITSVGADDRIMGTDHHHRLLIQPDAFHVSVLFRPTLSWLDRIAAALPPGIDLIRSSSSVLDEFVLKIYLPQLEEKVTDLFLRAVAGMLLYCLLYVLPIIY